MLTNDDKHWIERLIEERCGRLREVTKKRITKLYATLVSEFRKGDSLDDLRKQSRAAVLRVNELELESLSDRLKNLEGR